MGKYSCYLCRWKRCPYGIRTSKQFIEVDGKPIIIHTLEIFEEHPAVDAIYVACKEDYISRLQKLVKRF